MRRRLTQAVAIFGVVFAAAQLVRPDRTNPPIDPSRTIQAHVGTTGELPAILQGRQAVNFSEWSSYSPSQRQTLLAASCDDASTGRMPGPWTLLRPETRLSSRDIETICAAAQQTPARAAGGSQ